MNRNAQNKYMKRKLLLTFSIHCTYSADGLSPVGWVFLLFFKSLLELLCFLICKSFYLFQLFCIYIDWDNDIIKRTNATITHILLLKNN